MEESIKVEVRFFTVSEGGREQLPSDLLSIGVYRPHFVVGNPDQKKPIHDKNNCSSENYLGIVFVGQDEPLTAGNIIHAEVQKPYEGVDYSELKKGATFTIREGRSIVGNGKVL